MILTYILLPILIIVYGIGVIVCIYLRDKYRYKFNKNILEMIILTNQRINSMTDSFQEILDEINKSKVDKNGNNDKKNNSKTNKKK